MFSGSFGRVSLVAFVHQKIPRRKLFTHTPDARLFVISKMHRGIALIETCLMLASLIRSENV